MRYPLKMTAKLAKYVATQRMRGAEKFPMVMMLEPLHACNLTCTGCGRIREYKSTINEVMTVEQCMAASDECGVPENEDVFLAFARAVQMAIPEESREGLREAVGVDPLRLQRVPPLALPDMLQAALLVIDTLEIAYGVGQRCRRVSVLSLVQKLLYPLINVFKRQIFIAAIHESAPPRVYRDGARD